MTMVVPTGREPTVQVATPTPFSGTAAHSVAVAVVNLTLPVGIARIATPATALVSVTVARKVTACPEIDGLGEDVNVVDVERTGPPPNAALAMIRAMTRRVKNFRFTSASLSGSS